jgi:hypothetical protein
MPSTGEARVVLNLVLLPVVRSVEEAAEGTAYSYILVTFKCLPDGQFRCLYYIYLAISNVLVLVVVNPTADLIAPLLCTKAAIERPPTIVLLQNGINIERAVQDAFPKCPIISVVIWIGMFSSFSSFAVCRFVFWTRLIVVFFDILKGQI